MAHWYDMSTTVFNPEGRLHQIEYAAAAVAKAGTCIGIVAQDGVLLAAQRRKIDKLLDESMYLEKIYKLHSDAACAVAGVIADGNLLMNEARAIAERHFKRYRESIPCEQLVSSLCDLKQAYTQYGGKRPFGVSALYMGWDRHNGYQLYRSDPCGNYFGWKAISVGKNSEAVISTLQTEYEENSTTLKSAQLLALKCLKKCFVSGHLFPEKVEMALLTRTVFQTKLHILNKTEIEGLIQEFEDAQSEASKEC